MYTVVARECSKLSVGVTSRSDGNRPWLVHNAVGCNENGPPLETYMRMGTAGIPRVPRDFRGNVAVFYFMVHLHRQNAFTVHFFRIQNVGCLITMIAQIGTSASANVDNFFY